MKDFKKRFWCDSRLLLERAAKLFLKLFFISKFLYFARQRQLQRNIEKERLKVIILYKSSFISRKFVYLFWKFRKQIIPNKQVK